MLSVRASTTVLVRAFVSVGCSQRLDEAASSHFSSHAHSMNASFRFQSGRINVQPHSAHTRSRIGSGLMCRLLIITCAKEEPSNNFPSPRESKTAGMWIKRRPTPLTTSIVQKGTVPKSTQHSMIQPPPEARPSAEIPDPNSTPMTPWDAFQTCEATQAAFTQTPEPPVLLL